MFTFYWWPCVVLYFQVHLNDSHFQMIIHWAGKSSDVIVAMTRDIKVNNNSNSCLYLSYDYGATYQNKTNNLKYNKTVAVLDRFYNSPVYNSHVSIIQIWTCDEGNMEFRLRQYCYWRSTKPILPNIKGQYLLYYMSMFMIEAHWFMDTWIVFNNLLPFPVLRSGASCYYCDIILPYYDVI